MRSTPPNPSTKEIPDNIAQDIVREALMAARDVAVRETSAEAAATAVTKAGIAAWLAIADVFRTTVESLPSSQREELVREAVEAALREAERRYGLAPQVAL